MSSVNHEHLLLTSTPAYLRRVIGIAVAMATGRNFFWHSTCAYLRGLSAPFLSDCHNR